MNRIRQGSRKRVQGVSGEGSERTVLQNGFVIAYDLMTAVGIGACSHEVGEYTAMPALLCWRLGQSDKIVRDSLFASRPAPPRHSVVFLRPTANPHCNACSSCSHTEGIKMSPYGCPPNTHKISPYRSPPNTHKISPYSSPPNTNTHKTQPLCSARFPFCTCQQFACYHANAFTYKSFTLSTAHLYRRTSGHCVDIFSAVNILFTPVIRQRFSLHTFHLFPFLIL